MPLEIVHAMTFWNLPLITVDVEFDFPLTKANLAQMQRFSLGHTGPGTQSVSSDPHMYRGPKGEEEGKQ